MRRRTQIEMPDWYGLLGVDPGASADEVRAAWRTATADLDPVAPSFRAFNQAAEVLLDPKRRAAYDASRPAVDSESSAPAPTREPVGRDARAGGEASGRRLPVVPGWLVAVLAVLTAISLGWVAWLLATPSDADLESATRQAQSAAERAVVPVLAYDAADMEGSQAAAQEWLSADYREEYDKLFAVLTENADSTGTKVDVDVLASSVVRSGEDRVDVLLFVNRPTTNKASSQPTVYRDQVTLTMEIVAGEWVVDAMTTSPVQG